MSSESLSLGERLIENYPDNWSRTTGPYLATMETPLEGVFMEALRLSNRFSDGPRDLCGYLSSILPRFLGIFVCFAGLDAPTEIEYLCNYAHPIFLRDGLEHLTELSLNGILLPRLTRPSVGDALAKSGCAASVSLSCVTIYGDTVRATGPGLGLGGYGRLHGPPLEGSTWESSVRNRFSALSYSSTNSSLKDCRHIMALWCSNRASRLILAGQTLYSGWDTNRSMSPVVNDEFLLWLIPKVYQSLIFHSRDGLPRLKSYLCGDENMHEGYPPTIGGVAIAIARRFISEIESIYSMDRLRVLGKVLHDYPDHISKMSDVIIELVHSVSSVNYMPSGPFRPFAYASYKQKQISM